MAVKGFNWSKAERQMRLAHSDGQEVIARAREHRRFKHGCLFCKWYWRGLVGEGKARGMRV